MGTTTNDNDDDIKRRTNLDVKPFNISAIEDCNYSDNTFYSTYDDSVLKQQKQQQHHHIISKHDIGETVFEFHMNDNEIQQEVEISDPEYDSDEDKSSIISGLSNDHNYNMLPVVEPLSPISSSRSTPDSWRQAITDLGYESQLSPTSSTLTDDLPPLIDLDQFPFWDDSISELFPTLA